MNHLHLVGLIVCAALFAGCESTEMASNNNRAGDLESRQRAAEQQQQQGQARVDEEQQNLWSAQRNLMNRDGNVMRGN